MKLGARDIPRPTGRPSCYRCGHELSPAERVFCGACGSPRPVLVPAHHGAGVTTLAAATGFLDTEEQEAAITHPQAMRLLVSRTHHAGLEAARIALAHSRREGRGYSRLLLVPDAPGKLPKVLADQVTILTGSTPITRIPWVEAWRWAPSTSTETFVKFYPTLAGQLVADRP